MSDTTRVDINRIFVDPAFNSREIPDPKKNPDAHKLYQSKLESLAASIKSEGQLSPVLVVPSTRDGYLYDLVAGFRRVSAVRLLEKPTIECVVQDIDKAEDRAVANLAENSARDDLSPYELAKGCRNLRDTYRMTGNQIAIRIGAQEGMSKSYINNLLRILDTCPKKVIEAWATGHPQAQTDKLIKMSSKAYPTEADKLALWAEWTGAKDDEGDDDEKDGEDSKPSGKPKATRATESNLAAALHAVKAVSKASTFAGLTPQEAMQLALEYALGKRKSLKNGTHVIYDPAQAKAEKAKAEAAAEKAKKAEEKASKKAEKDDDGE